MRKILDWFQNLYEDLDDKKIWGAYAVSALLGAGAVVFFLSIPFFYKQDQLQNSLNDVNKQIDALNIEALKRKKNSLNTQRMKLNSRLEQLRSDLLILRSQYHAYSFTKTGTDKVSGFLDTVMKRSKTYNLSLQEVANNPPRSEDTLHTVTIKGSGDYVNIVTYLHELLEFQALMQLESYSVWLEENSLVFEANYTYAKEAS